MSATVRDVMTTRVIAVKRDADFKQIVRVLRHFRVSACPVIDDAGRVLGVVSEADLLYKEADPNPPSGLIRLKWKLGEESKANAATAGRLMTSPAIAISPAASVVAAARVMQNRQIKRLPVVDDAGCLIGIVSRADLLSVYERPDSDILDDVTKVFIDEEFALDPEDFQIGVTSGVVTICGTMDHRESGLNLVARVRHTESVVAVRERLTYREPA
jgi:CBS-domain-containing membrane protein